MLKAVEAGRGKHWTWLKKIRNKDIRKKVWREDVQKHRNTRE